MLALVAALFLSSPVPPPACRYWYSHTEHRCRDEDVEVIGPWDPRPAPADWPTHYYTPPEPWGAYPLEKRLDAPPLTSWP